MYAVANQLRRHTGHSPQRAVRAAGYVVERARRNQKLLADKNGKYRVTDVKGVFPSKEGRGKGPAKKQTGVWAAQIRRLAWHFLTTPKTPDWDWRGLYQQCKDEGITRSKKQYEKVRPAALEYAEKELASRIRTGVGIRNAHLPLSQEEAAMCEANIRSWKKRGRPKGNSAVIE
jgi:hypothetical protein